MMNPTSTAYKNAVLEMMPDATRIGKGQRWVVELADGRRCLMKSNLRGNLMTKASDGTVDAELSGFGDDVSHVFAVVGPLENPSAWVVPIDEVERQYREQHASWLAESPNHSLNNTTWVLTDLEIRFKGYEHPLVAKAITPEEARRGLAVHFGTTPEKISISVSV